ncbi:PP2C family protein-serine/threonine phosphatase [Leptospira sp. GIMC2001]|uniref:PP2C family protein-serine/threonine phosphatase n=1 Tax=Leptospira sp. GIMC2001 TaxID=1513297 RepID=UPI002349163B|nr:PP2C family protein-serine/threonine phosphatase [Leptospira sp. GIMC2001]WCL48996.1 PP2C family protein-serine/threonine phosphatase [Leptospira sp. GIMC2001]
MANEQNTTEDEDKGYRFQLTDYWKKQLHEIQVEGEIRAEVFASKFRFFFITMLAVFTIMSQIGGRPVHEAYFQMTAISILFFFNIFVTFFLRKSTKEKVYYPTIKYTASFLEITLLTTILWFLADTSKNPMHIYSGAMGFLYFTLVALASIRNRRSVIYFAGALALIQYGGLMIYFYADITPIMAMLKEYTDVLAPAMTAAGSKFILISVAPMGIILKTFYMGATVFLIIYSIQNANETAKRQANLMFDTEKKAILQENMRLGMELDVARQLQAMVLPTDLETNSCPGLEVAAMMEAADEVGGDYYDCYPMKDGSTYFAIGDVTGHGLQSGVVMMMAQSSYRTALERDGSSLSDMLNSINGVLYGNINGRMNDSRNLTLSLFRYNNGKIHLTGQHEDFLFMKSGSKKAEVVDTADLGIYVGLTDNIEAMVSEKEFAFNVGDAFLGYTDGVTEAENMAKHFYGHERLVKKFEEVAHKPATEIIKEMYSDLREFMGEREILDDISFIVVKRTS